jgi:hypothetical protein
VTTLGRSEECEVTIEDPLVSRRHAQIAVDGDEVRVIDLGSRNGVRLNGHPVEGSALLADGDRVRIGTQDLVFTRVAPRVSSPHGNRTTGVLRLCAQCKLPFARETTGCPHCGASEQTDEDTITGTFGHESQHSWSVQLLLEAIDKALGMGRVPDADRVVEGGTLEPKQVAHAALAAASICIATSDPSWGSWIPRFYERASLYPPAEVSNRLTKLVELHPELLGLLPPLGQLVPAREPSGDDVAALTRLCALAELATTGPAPRIDESNSPE